MKNIEFTSVSTVDLSNVTGGWCSDTMNPECYNWNPVYTGTTPGSQGGRGGRGRGGRVVNQNPLGGDVIINMPFSNSGDVKRR